MIHWPNFNRDTFTAEEQHIIESFIDSGNVEKLTQAITVDRPEKEYWVQKIVSAYKHVEITSESKASDEMRQLLEKGEQITPEIEAQFQKKIDEERRLEKERIELEEKRMQAGMAETAAKTDRAIEVSVPEAKVEVTIEEKPKAKRGPKAKAKVEETVTEPEA